MSVDETCIIETDEDDFWHHATIYTTEKDDKSFINEIAYMMVTLHGNGS
jgi:hypothetical protein